MSELWPTHGAVVFSVIVRLHPEAGVWFALSAASMSFQYVSTSRVLSWAAAAVTTDVGSAQKGGRMRYVLDSFGVKQSVWTGVVIHCRLVWQFTGVRRSKRVWQGRT